MSWSSVTSQPCPELNATRAARLSAVALPRLSLLPIQVAPAVLAHARAALVSSAVEPLSTTMTWSTCLATAESRSITRASGWYVTTVAQTVDRSFGAWLICDQF